MKAFLLFENEDFESVKKFPPQGQTLIHDLALNVLFSAMAAGDDFIFKVVNEVLLSGIYNNTETIIYRQQILNDCLNHPQMIRDIYRIANEAILSKNKHWWALSSSPSSILYSSINTLRELLIYLQQLRNIADNHYVCIHSKGFTRFFAMLQQELNDEFFNKANEHLTQLEFRNGVMFSTQLGTSNRASYYQLCKLNTHKKGWLQWFRNREKKEYVFNIHPRDESGIRALRELTEEGVLGVSNALAQSVEHIISFFQMLKTETAFYVGCLNLSEQLQILDEPMTFPIPLDYSERTHTFKDLYDICLALTLKQKVIGNDLQAENKVLFIITGANQGGKSTFLRSIGIAQLMMQSGMFVPALYFSANVCDALFTHFRREEDLTMQSGKLDEELNRMNKIVDQLTPNAMILFNESFAATNDREGSEICRQMANVLYEDRIKVFFVTHLYEFAHYYYEKHSADIVFLRADRQPDGTRTFRLIEGEPLQTSFGKDLYEKIFEAK